MPALLRHELLDVDARRHLDDRPDVTDHVFQHLANVPRADVGRLGLGQRLAPPRLEPWVAAHRVLELRSVRLDPERHPGRRSDRRAHQHVVRKHEIGGPERAQGHRVRLDIACTFLLAEVLEQPRLEPVVAVEDEDRQQSVWQLGPDDPRAGQVVLVGVRLLAEDGHIVTGVAPIARERARVDVRPGPAEQVAVPDEDPHGEWLLR